MAPPAVHFWMYSISLTFPQLWDGLPGSSAGKESACDPGDPRGIPGSGNSPWRRDRLPTLVFIDFPGGSDGKESACSVEVLVSIPGLGRSPGRGHGNPLQYSCLQNPMDRGAWWAPVHGVLKSLTRLKQLNTTAQLWDCGLALPKGILHCIKEHAGCA